MRVLAKGALCVALLAAGCSRNNIEAVNLANEGDQAKGSNLDEAISKYEQATKLDPTNHRILWKLVLAYHKKEAWDKVATTCSAALSNRSRTATRSTGCVCDPSLMAERLYRPDGTVAAS